MQGFDAATSPAPLAEPGQTILVFEEKARIEKRAVETGRTRIAITVSEHDETVAALLMRQDIVIERVTVDRVVAEAPPVRRDGDTIVIPILEEVLVTEKRLVLREELHIRIDETRRTINEVVTLRRENATVEELEINLKEPS